VHLDKCFSEELFREANSHQAKVIAEGVIKQTFAGCGQVCSEAKSEVIGLAVISLIYTQIETLCSGTKTLSGGPRTVALD
jgi:hypothetical protein